MTTTPKLIQKALEDPSLSICLRSSLRLATRTGSPDIARWCQLELGGYYASNPAMSEEVTVPEYRTVVGQHRDLYGRVLQLEPGLSFVNETRLRNGVEELEHLVRTKETVSIHDPGMCQTIRDHLNVEVFSFSFSSTHLVGVLSAIRLALSTKLSTIEAAARALPPQSGQEVLVLRPNFHGIGIDLRALWERLFGQYRDGA